MAAKPNKLTIRAYQVGFGDCFLLTFHYASGDDRHVLIDYGSTAHPKTGAPPNLMRTVANDIAAECGGKLHGVVVTHRHKDHISGFETDGGTASKPSTGNIIRALKPDIVVQPWTEDPQAARDARKPTMSLRGARGARALGARALADMHAFAGEALKELANAQNWPKNLKAELAFIGEDNLKNASAVRNLMTMAQKKQRYVYYGSDSELESVLPGVKVTVVGPPTLEQSKDIEEERAEDQAEFWHLQATATARVNAGKQLFTAAKRFKGGALPAYARWFAPRLDRIRGDQLLELVRALDDAMNNTSVILLFEAGGKRFLFPGDAQIENWAYALKTAPDHKAMCDKLAKVDFYKVGHHGSLNATPKTLWALFDRKSDKTTTPGRLRTVVSTLAGKYGNADKGTEVPRTKLVDELKKNSTFSSTQELTKNPATDRLRETITFNL